MGKRSEFRRRAGDDYRTPPECVIPLIPHIKGVKEFEEPCAGDGRLAMTLMVMAGKVNKIRYDVDPKHEQVKKGNALHRSPKHMVITNPPWTRQILHAMIRHWLDSYGQCILLFDSDWMQTSQAEDLLKHCYKIVPIGRVKWIPGTDKKGKDNCSWYFFNVDHTSYPVHYPRRRYIDAIGDAALALGMDRNDLMVRLHQANEWIRVECDDGTFDTAEDGTESPEAGSRDPGGEHSEAGDG